MDVPARPLHLAGMTVQVWPDAEIACRVAGELLIENRSTRPWPGAAGRSWGWPPARPPSGSMPIWWSSTARAISHSAT